MIKRDERRHTALVVANEAISKIEIAIGYMISGKAFKQDKKDTEMRNLKEMGSMKELYT